jgi:hypothetical protein
MLATKQPSNDLFGVEQWPTTQGYVPWKPGNHSYCTDQECRLWPMCEKTWWRVGNNHCFRHMLRCKCSFGFHNLSAQVDIEGLYAQGKYHRMGISFTPKFQNTSQTDPIGSWIMIPFHRPLSKYWITESRRTNGSCSVCPFWLRNWLNELPFTYLVAQQFRTYDHILATSRLYVRSLTRIKAMFSHASKMGRSLRALFQGYLIMIIGEIS